MSVLGRVVCSRCDSFVRGYSDQLITPDSLTLFKHLPGF